MSTPSVQDMFEREIYNMLLEAKGYKEKLAAAKTAVKKKYYEKKLQHLNPIIDRAIEIYDIYKQRKAEEAAKQEATLNSSSEQPTTEGVE